MKSVHKPKNGLKKTTLLKDIRKNPVSYLLALPAIVWIAVFSYATYPYMVIAFEKFNYKTGIRSPWIGLKNFEFFFKSNDAFRIIFNTLYLNLLSILIGTLCSLALALILNELLSKWFVKTSQSIMILPNYFSWVVVSYMLYAMLSTDYGILNNLLRSAGLEPIAWYSRADLWPGILTIAKTWKSAGMNAIIYLAAITGIDRSMYEAAAMDGANRWQQCLRITLPALAPTICILTIMSIGKIMFGDYGMIYALVGDNGVLFSTTDVIDTYIFRSLRKTGDPSISTAIGLFQSAVGFFMVWGANKITKKLFPEGALY